MRSIYQILALSACFFILVTCAEKKPPLVPRETIFGNPTKAKPKISPDGMRMAYLAPHKGVLNVWVKTIGQEDDRVVTRDSGRGIHRYFWAEDNERIMFLQDRGGNENWRLYAVQLASDQIGDLTPYENVQVRIMEHNKHFPNELLFLMNKDNPKLHDVYHLNLKTGEIRQIAKNPGNVVSWMADADFKVRAATATNRSGGLDLLVRKSEKDPWSKIVTWDQEDNFSSGAVSFTRDGTAMVIVDSRNANTGRLIKIDLEDKSTSVIVEDPVYDINEVMLHPDAYEVQAVSFIKVRLEWLILDKSIQADFDAIAQLDYGDYVVYDRDSRDKTWLVGFTKDNGPVAYYAFDRDKKLGTFLFHHRPELTTYTLAPMKPILCTARDGLKLHGYITFPPGKPLSNLPMVVNVHGGPWSRNIWGYHPEAQWLANRGYICLQINFRGSSGYGKEFLNAGNKEWGGKMHNDIVDAVKWAIKRGYTSPGKVAIYGGSYGGYAALAGATFTPDLFTCAVDLVGPSNLLTWINSVPPYWAPFKDILNNRVGNPVTEKELLKSRSPLFSVDSIRIPMLIAQGANDPRVPKAESEQIVAALKEKGIDHEYLLFQDEGHGFVKPENRLKFYAAAEKFLAKHLGGRCEE
jgi:dipeptidyl aminopeptidase/acylaminoacyl peptidase